MLLCFICTSLLDYRSLDGSKCFAAIINNQFFLTKFRFCFASYSDFFLNTIYRVFRHVRPTPACLLNVIRRDAQISLHTSTSIHIYTHTHIPMYGQSLTLGSLNENVKSIQRLHRHLHQRWHQFHGTANMPCLRSKNVLLSSVLWSVALPATIVANAI